ncbi:MAG: alpha-mannosidase [Candidatus Limnocylindrales bacterium]
MSEPTILHLVPHTHWDREWYEPFQTFRLRLVELVDQLLARMEQDDRLCFTLDGQAATVDDYLEVRPEAEPIIRRLIAEGRLAIGPWQILLDEFLVSGETIIRNLEFGWARAEELGGAMPVGYLPDMFGHVAQMPQILRRAGIGHAVVWRGVPLEVAHHTFGWSAPDGSRVVTEYLVGGYGNGAYLFDVPGRLADKLVEYRHRNAGFYGERSLLAMYGTDHAVPSPRLADMVDAVNALDSDVRVRMETLADYVSRDRPPAEGTLEWTGELRSGARANMLMNVVSARVDVKAAAARAERLLERYAEPLTALHGAAWPARLLELAWRRVVDNSAHDSICGCSHDAVNAQVLGRYAEAEQIASGIVRTTLAQIAGRVQRGAFAVVNPSPADRSDLVRLEVAVPEGWTSVVAMIGDETLVTQEIHRAEPLVARVQIPARDIPEFFRRRRHGRELFGRWMNGVRLEAGDADRRPRLIVMVDTLADPPELDVEALLGSVDVVTETDPAAVWDIVVEAPERRIVLVQVPAPALGWTQLALADGAGHHPTPVAHPVAVTANGLDNGLVEVTVADDGTMRLAGGGSVLEGVGRIVDGGDFGDSYNYGPPTADTLVDTPQSVDTMTIEHGPLRGVLKVDRRFAWPTGLAVDGSARTREAADTTVTTRLELRAGEPFVRVRLDFENRSKDHRVRWHIPLAGPVERSSAEGQFAVVDRGLTVEGGHGEVPLPTFPAHGFVHADGVSILLDQVTEYEIVEGRELALTVLRSFGLISRNINPYREDPAGPEVTVPMAQLMGPCTFAFALYPHRGSWRAAMTVARGQDVRQPFLTVAGTARASDGAPAGGLRIDGDGIVLSALRRRAAWLELRLVNEGPGATQATVHAAIDDARDVDLLGRPIPAPTNALLGVGPGQVRLRMGPWEIRTIQIRIADEPAVDMALQR